MSAEGRRPPFYLGIDLGGTNIKGGVVDDDGRPVSSVSLPTHAEDGPEEGVQSLAEVGKQAVSQSGLDWSQIAGVGLGTPGTMDIQGGMLLDPPNLPKWTNFPVRDRLAQLLNTRTVLQNDANAAAYGEYWAGAGRGVHSLVLLTLGTGIGCGIVQEGRIVEGRHSHGGECGHFIIQMEGGRVCSCGQTGHLEAYASATSLVKRAHEAIAAAPESSLARLEPREVTARSIDQAANAGDPLAVRLMAETARYLAVGATCLMHTIDPDIVLFSGGMIAAGSSFLEAIRAEVKRIAFPVPAAKTRIEFAELGGDAGFIGAAGWARATFGA